MSINKEKTECVIDKERRSEYKLKKETRSNREKDNTDNSEEKRKTDRVSNGEDRRSM